MNLGYACINMTLQERKPDKVTCNSSMIKRTFLAKGTPYASELEPFPDGSAFFSKASAPTGGRSRYCGKIRWIPAAPKF